MKKTMYFACLLFFISTKGLVQEVNKEQQPELNAIEKACLKKLEGKFEPSFYKDCVEQAEREQFIEKITVNGRYIGIEVPEVAGRFHLNRDFIENAPKTGGDINELIAMLPGVQVSSDANNLDNLAEISAQQISISGAQPWQTGFYVDGLNYNNRVDPGSQVRTSDSANNVTGGAQTMNISSDIVSSITVYDNNVPAEYGDFSGGIVEAQTLDPFKDKETTFSIGYRGNRGDWVDYHYVYGERSDDLVNVQEFTANEPIYEKNNYSVLISQKLNQHHGVTVSHSQAESIISDISLNQLKNRRVTNSNTMLKYGYNNGWIDRLSVSIMNAPYQNNTYIKDVLKSDYTLDGGSFASTIEVKHGFDSFSWKSNLNYSKSDNSRVAPDHLYSWALSKGKEWGKYGSFDTIDETVNTILSVEGGYGDLDNSQERLNWKNRFDLDAFTIGATEHNAYFGIDAQHSSVTRNRKNDNYQYSGGVIYSTQLDGPSLNCSGYLLDCVEQELNVPIDELTANLGGELDFGNLEHAFAYSNNIVTTAQYFQYRLVTPAELINVDLIKANAYLTDQFTIEQADFSLGLRYDWDDFYQNYNLAPRLSLGYDVFDNGYSLLILGANRYYSAGLLNNKIKAQQRPSYDQFRSIADGNLQGWQDLAGTPRFRYRFKDLDTPYDDEFVVGWKQSTYDIGNFAIKYVRRLKHDQLSRDSETLQEQDGFSYIEMNNEGSGNSKRISLSWDGQFNGHSFWFNTSFAKNYSSVSSYNIPPEQIPLDELVLYNGELISREKLDVLSDNFSQPLIYNFGWSHNWLGNLSTSVSGVFSERYTTPIHKGNRRIGVEQLCRTCSQRIDFAVPYYEDIDKRARLQVNLSAKWVIKFATKQRLELRADINNLFNSRSYNIEERAGESGIEPGRQYWVGVKYSYD